MSVLEQLQIPAMVCEICNSPASACFEKGPIDNVIYLCSPDCKIIYEGLHPRAKLYPFR